MSIDKLHCGYWADELRTDRRAADNKGFAIPGGRASQTHLCKVEVQFSE